MIAFDGRGILLDIEGTTSSVRFVYDVMFPFVRRELQGFLAARWGEPELMAACEQIARDAGSKSLADWCPTQSLARLATGARLDTDADASEQRAAIAREALRLMDADVKATGLKQLQGLVWEAGFASGELQAHVYDDIVPALRAWHAAGFDLRVYSSGSVHAQRLFFANTVEGDLLPLFRGHFDTAIGGKKEAASYTRIASEFGLPPCDILFLSDIVAELDAARAVGMKTGLVVRPDNVPVAAPGAHDVIHQFSEIECGNEAARISRFRKAT